MIKVCNILLVILFVMFFVSSCAPGEAETLYNKAVDVEYKSGMVSALPHYETIIEKHPDSQRAIQAREKVIAYRKEVESKQIEEEKKRALERLHLEEERKRKEEERIRKEEEERRQREEERRREEKRKEEERKRREAQRKREEAERIASFHLTESQAFRLVTDECDYIRRRANFIFSQRCEFTILDVKTVGSGFNKIAKITVYGKGFIYDLTFTVTYGLTYDNDGEFISEFIEVRKGRVTGLSDLAQEFLKK